MLEKLRNFFVNTMEENVLVAAVLLKLLSVPGDENTPSGTKLLLTTHECQISLLNILLEIQEEINEHALGIEYFEEILEQHKQHCYGQKVRRVVAKTVEENIEQVKIKKICDV